MTAVVRISRPLRVLLGVWLACWVTIPVAAQSPECPARIEQALSATRAACAAVAPGTACYGSPSITAAFRSPQIFRSPGDTASLAALDSIVTRADDQQIGIAVLQPDALLSETRIGQPVTYTLIANMTLTDAGDAIFVPAARIPVELPANTNLRAGPDLAFDVVETLTAGTSVWVDARSDTGWVRVISGENVAWIDSGALEAVPADLPVLTEQSEGPMQAFTLRGGVGGSSCEAMPDALLIQSSARAQVQANGAQVGSARGMVLTVPQPDTLVLTVLDGEARIADGRILRAGFKAALPLDPVSGQVAGDWGPFEPLEIDHPYGVFAELPQEPALPSEGYLTFLNLAYQDVAYDYTVVSQVDPNVVSSINEESFDLESFLNFNARTNPTPAPTALPPGCAPGICSLDIEIACECVLCGVPCPEEDEEDE